MYGDAKIKVVRVEFDGLDRTDRTLMRDYFEPVLQSATLDRLTQSLNAASAKCHQLQIFKNISIHIEPCDEEDAQGDRTGSQQRQLVKVRVQVQERKAKFFVGSEWLSSNDLVGVSTCDDFRPLLINFLYVESDWQFS